MWQDPKNGDISVREVLDFLRTAYQVHEAVDGAPIRVDWGALSSNPLLSRLKETAGDETPENASFDSKEDNKRCNSLDVSKRRNSSSDGVPSRQSSIEKNMGEKSRRIVQRRRNSLTSKKEVSIDAGGKTAERYIKRKLNQVLQEGILDSVLPYILSRQSQSIKKSLPQAASGFVSCELANNDGKKSSSSSTETSSSTGFVKKESRRKSTSSLESKPTEKKDVEVVIHVCDEVKNMKKDFRCAQSLLVSRMKYFGEVTAGQRLEDMDISVHCDVSIFDWLIRWVKQEGSPTLDTSIVIPVLMSSAFLQMDSLQETCLEFCRSHINEVIRDSSNLGCINDSVLTRLANLFSNTELEALKDRKDKLLSKLYCKMIAFLAEPIPQERRGHYYSIAYLFKCSKCGNLVSQQLSLQTNCVPRHIRMNHAGQLSSKHLRDPSWSLNELVRQLKVELKTWRKVYWRLWGISHHLNCSFCASPFPLYHMAWCYHHSEPAQFFSMEHQRTMSFPVGRYPCCGDRAFRFEILPCSNGCQQREHIPEARNETDRSILKIYKEHRDLIRIEVGEEEIEAKPSVSKETLWWEGIELAPQKTKQGLLGSWLDPIFKIHEKRGSGETKVIRPAAPLATPVPEISSYSDSSESESSGSCGESEESYHATVRVTTKPRGTNSLIHAPPIARKEGGQIWVAKLSTRCNQDNQREFEERAIRHIEKLLTKKTSGESLSSGLRGLHSQDPPGGTYVRLEAEWREAHCNSYGCPGSSKLRLTTSCKPKIKR